MPGFEVFGKEEQKGIRLKGLKLEVVTIGNNGVEEADLLIHDATEKSSILHYMLLQMKLPEFPVAMGIIRNVKATVYDQELHSQINFEKENTKFDSLNKRYIKYVYYE